MPGPRELGQDRPRPGRGGGTRDGSARVSGVASRGWRRPRVGIRSLACQRGGERAREQLHACPRGEADGQARVGDAMDERGSRQAGQFLGRRGRRRSDEDGQAGVRAVAEQLGGAPVRAPARRAAPTRARHRRRRSGAGPRRVPLVRRRHGRLVPRNPRGAARRSAPAPRRRDRWPPPTGSVAAGSPGWRSRPVPRPQSLLAAAVPACVGPRPPCPRRGRLPRRPRASRRSPAASPSPGKPRQVRGRWRGHLRGQGRSPACDGGARRAPPEARRASRPARRRRRRACRAGPPPSAARRRRRWPARRRARTPPW